MQVFDINGTAYNVNVREGEKAPKSVSVMVNCIRCGGQGGWSGWPGWTCYRCGGERKESASVKVYPSMDAVNKALERKAKAEVRKIEKDRALYQQGLELNPDAEAFLALGLHSDFANSLERKVLKGQQWTEGQALAARKALESRQERKAKEEALKQGNHLGTVGDKLTFTGTVTRVYEGTGFYGPYALITIETDDGVVVWKSSGKTIEKGTEGTFTAKVKEHSEYKGIPQTIVTHLKQEKD